MTNRLERHIGDTYRQRDWRDTLKRHIDKQIGKTHWIHMDKQSGDTLETYILTNRLERQIGNTY